MESSKSILGSILKDKSVLSRADVYNEYINILAEMNHFKTYLEDENFGVTQ